MRFCESSWGNWEMCFSCMPSDLDGAVQQSSEATAAFVSAGGMRAIVCSTNCSPYQIL